MAPDNPKLSELDGDDRDEKLRYVQGRWAQFASATREARKDAARFIATINAGGAVAILGFIGTVSEKSELAKALSIRLALLAFVVGVVSCGFAHAVENAYLTGLFAKWRKGVQEFYEDKVGFTDMIEADTRRAEQHDVAEFFIWAALACFGIGGLLGILVILGGD